MNQNTTIVFSYFILPNPTHALPNSISFFLLQSLSLIHLSLNSKIGSICLLVLLLLLYIIFHILYYVSLIDIIIIDPWTAYLDYWRRVAQINNILASGSCCCPFRNYFDCIHSRLNSQQAQGWHIPARRNRELNPVIQSVNNIPRLQHVSSDLSLGDPTTYLRRRTHGHYDHHNRCPGPDGGHHIRHCSHWNRQSAVHTRPLPRTHFLGPLVVVSVAANSLRGCIVDCCSR